MTTLPAILACLTALVVFPATAPQREMALTFDDLPAQRSERLPPERVTRILRTLTATLGRERLPAVGFVNESKLYSDGELRPDGVRLLEGWLEAGLELGNHTYSHPDLHRVSLALYQRDLLRGEQVIRGLSERHGMPLRFFRHPFLHSGRDLETKRRLDEFLDRRGYRIAPVTIDNSEWIFARAYDEALDRGDQALGRRLGAAYVDYMEEMTAFYERQSREILGREIPQILLLHANALNADHLAELLERLRGRGYRFVELAAALDDPAYEAADEYTGPAGLSWIQRWGIARGVDRAVFRDEPATPAWVEELAGIRD